MKMNVRKINFFILILIFISIKCGVENNNPPNNNFTKIITGEKIMLKYIGEEFQIKVSVEQAIDVVGLNAWISYDPSIVEVVDGDPSIANTQVITNDLGFLPNAQLLVNIQKDANGVEQPGTVICGYASIPATPTTGSGDCFDIRFKAIAQGTTDIDFVVGRLNLQDIDGDIPTNGIGDLVDVPTTATVKITVL